MSDSLRESISALVDDEAQELELHRVLGSMGSDEELRQKWRRYQAVSFSIKRQMDCRFDLDISDRVAAAIAEEPVVVAEVATGERNNKPRFGNLFKPALSMAVAASAAFVVIFAVQFSGSDDASTQLASGAQPLTTHLSAGAEIAGVPVLAVGSEILTPVEKRLQSLIENHAQQASMSQNRGVMPSSHLVSDQEVQGY
jgi:sigma-E factor negative regulatory protein RseA